MYVGPLMNISKLDFTILQCLYIIHSRICNIRSCIHWFLEFADTYFWKWSPTQLLRLLLNLKVHSMCSIVLKLRRNEWKNESFDRNFKIRHRILSGESPVIEPSKRGLHGEPRRSKQLRYGCLLALENSYFLSFLNCTAMSKKKCHMGMIVGSSPRQKLNREASLDNTLKSPKDKKNRLFLLARSPLYFIIMSSFAYRWIWNLFHWHIVSDFFDIYKKVSFSWYWTNTKKVP